MEQPPADRRALADRAGVDAVNGFDASYVVGLSADAVPALITTLPALKEHDRCTTAAQIAQRWSAPQHLDPFTWN